MATTSIPVVLLYATDSDAPSLVDSFNRKITLRSFTELDADRLKNIELKHVTRESTLLLEAAAFHGCGTPVRKFIGRIREKFQYEPKILVLRYGHNAAPDLSITANDINAGANDVIWYSSCTASRDARRVQSFIFTGKLPAIERTRHAPTGSNALNKLFHELSQEPDQLPDETLPIPPLTMTATAKEDPEMAVPTNPTPTHDSGDEIMPQTLLEQIVAQNSAILETLGDIRDFLRHSMENERARAAEELRTAMNRVLDQFQRPKETNVPASSHSTGEVPLSAPTGPTSDHSCLLSAASATKGMSPIATLEKHGRSGTVILFGQRIDLSYGSAELFAHLVNTGETMGTADISATYRIGLQGSYVRINTLLDGLEKFRKGLPRCLTLIKSGNANNYRFDADEFRKVFGMK